MNFYVKRYGQYLRTVLRLGWESKSLALVWRILIVLYFLAGFLIIGMRWFVTTQIEEHDADIEAFLSQTLGVTITAQSIQGGFNLIRPTLVFENVKLSRPGGPISLTIPKIEAEFSWSSLIHFEPRFHALVVSDPSLTVRRITATTFDIAGFIINTESATPDKSAGAASDMPFTSWLLGQNKIVLRRGAFTYIDETQENPRSVDIRNVEFVFEQRLLDWRAAVLGTIDDGSEKHASLKARVEKNLFSRAGNPLTWKGEAYAHFDSINVSNLLKRIGFTQALQRGEGAARLWAKFDSGRVTSFTSDLGIRNVRSVFGEGLEPLVLHWLRGRFTYTDDTEGHHAFTAERLEFQGAKRLRFGPANFGTDCTTGTAGELLSCDFSASEISIDTLTQLAPSLPIPNDMRKFLQEKTIAGTLRQFKASVRDDFASPDNWTFNGGFTGLSMQTGSDGLPGFRNLSGNITSDKPGEFVLTLSSRVSALTFPGIFREQRIHFDQISGRITAKLNPMLSLSFDDVRIKNADASVTGRGSWLATGGSGTIDIDGEILFAKCEAIHKYLPSVIGDDALNYTEAGVISGRVTRGSWIVKGALDKFPWDGAEKGTGLFRIEGDVVDGILDFLPSYRMTGNGSKRRFIQEEYWPRLTNIEGHLLFEGERMLINGKSGRSMNLQASDVVVEIPAFSTHPIELKIAGTAKGDLKDTLRYLKRGPMLREFIGGIFDDATGSGPVTTMFDLWIPLQNPEDTKYNITAMLEKDSLRYLPMLPEAVGLKGSLLINNQGVFTKEPIAGRLAQGPITVSASTSKDNVLTLDFAGTLTTEEVRRMLSMAWTDPLIEHAAGATTVKAVVEVPFSNPHLWRLTGSTDLTGITSTLPAPYAKTAETAWPVTFGWTPADKNSRSLLVDAPERLHFTLNFAEVKENDGTSYVATSGFLGFGSAKARPQNDIRIAADTPIIDLSSWMKALKIDNIESGLPEGYLVHKESDFLKRVSTIDVKTSDLRFKNNTLTDVDATLRHLYDAGVWHLRLQSQEASGQAELMAASSKRALGLTVKLNRLYLPEETADHIDKQIKTPKKPGMFPNLSVVIDDLKVGTREVGKIEIAAKNAKTPAGLDLWHISKLNVYNRGGIIHGNGRWEALPENANGRTSLSLHADIKSAGDILHSLNVRDVVRNAPGQLDAELSWLGRPFDFNMQSLTGTIGGHANRGELLQVDPGAGRLLSLLSMQHLLRRLTLDFRDVAGKGFSFDSFSINAALKNGILSTEKTTLVGSAATIVIGGDVDFVNEILDMRALVLPSINAEGASLALAVANPAIGIGTLIAQWVLKDQISQILSSEYNIHGTFDEPEIKKITPQTRQTLSTELTRP